MQSSFSETRHTIRPWNFRVVADPSVERPLAVPKRSTTLKSNSNVRQARSF